MSRSLKKIVKTGVIRIPARIERTFFFWATIIAVTIYLANRFFAY